MYPDGFRTEIDYVLCGFRMSCGFFKSLVLVLSHA